MSKNLRIGSGAGDVGDDGTNGSVGDRARGAAAPPGKTCATPSILRGWSAGKKAPLALLVPGVSNTEAAACNAMELSGSDRPPCCFGTAL